MLARTAPGTADEALTIILDAERDAPEQIRHHFISRQLVLRWIRQQHGNPATTCIAITERISQAKVMRWLSALLVVDADCCHSLPCWLSHNAYYGRQAGLRRRT